MGGAVARFRGHEARNDGQGNTHDRRCPSGEKNLNQRHVVGVSSSVFNLCACWIESRDSTGLCRIQEVSNSSRLSVFIGEPVNCVGLVKSHVVVRMGGVGARP